MTPDAPCCSRTTLNWIGILGAFLAMVVLMAALRHYTSVSTVDQARALERLKIRDETRQKEAVELATAAWIDKEKGVVRLPNTLATELAVKLWQDPVRARSNLVDRAAKAFFVPPPPPEKPSEFE